ncbi:hypothetical protein CCAX7_12430 [Capsulimonas corticalis]|uniref:Uncharacterized protein n=1 Tax=Capsulimonas corticalis TaxID=2219043 RepID=A0A402D4D9_9BACT|nr:hypothetical protein [Capsulimonas corticalis]BDI29192.1 hypothetical protein CCAX7_12430 [Capsulimonas corticalis]
MIYYYCAQCGQTLMPGLQMCQKCGQIFQHAVPVVEETGENRTEYWPPRAPTTGEQAVRRASNNWNDANPASKASIFAILAIFLIGFAITSQVRYTRSLAQSLPHADSSAYTATTSSQVSPRTPQAAYQPVFQPPSAQLVAKAEVGYNQMRGDRGTTLVITNQNNYAWSNIRVTINPSGGVPFSGRGSTLAAGYVLTVPLSEFTTSTGLRFDANNLKVNNVQISADTPSGPGTITVSAMPEGADAPPPPNIFRTPVANTPDPYGQADTTMPSPTPPQFDSNGNVVTN